jgi:hypothetical protein
LTKSLKILSEIKDPKVEEWIAKQYGEEGEDIQASKTSKGSTKKLCKKKSSKKIQSKDGSRISSSSSSDQSPANASKPKVLKGLNDRKKGEVKSNDESNESSSDSVVVLDKNQKKKNYAKADHVEDQASSSKAEAATAKTPAISWWKKIFSSISNKEAKAKTEYYEVCIKSFILLCISENNDYLK